MPVREGAPPVLLGEPAPRILIGAPMYGGQSFSGFLLGLFDLQGECARRGVPLGIQVVINESLIPRARNRVLHDFLRSDATHLIFVDSDIGFQGRDALRLVAHAQANPDAIVGGTYRKKTLDRVEFAFLPLPYGAPVSAAELVEVLALPGGFLCISRRIAERLAGARHEEWYTDSNLPGARIIDFCMPFIDRATHEYWSEDYALCRRWRELGGQILLDPNLQLSHTGTLTLEGDPREVFVKPSDLAPAAPAPARARQRAGRRATVRGAAA